MGLSPLGFLVDRRNKVGVGKQKERHFLEMWGWIYSEPLGLPLLP